MNYFPKKLYLTPLSLVVNEVCVDEEPILHKTADLVTFTKEILNKELHFFCSEASLIHIKNKQKLKTLLYGADVVNMEQ